MGLSHDNPVFSVGHSTLPVESFIRLLKRHGISAVADVRSFPYSKHNPQFNKESLAEALSTSGIKYVFLGRELGARTDDKSCYQDGRVQYDRLAQTAGFSAGIERVERGAHEHRIALMCAEREPLECHRTLLVSRALAGRGIRVLHILSDGRLESHDDAMERLLDLTGIPRGDMFRTRQDLLNEAIRKQESKIAYVPRARTDHE
ncbi:MAG TPA: DUF488 domain-containing protein [Usitatibacter sp.]|jgi:uncharacterized protein (DUF488 family)|nr:DUF488 domain-containing protein [Usitatibacter sp.]